MLVNKIFHLHQIDILWIKCFSHS